MNRKLPVTREKHGRYAVAVLCSTLLIGGAAHANLVSEVVDAPKMLSVDGMELAKNSSNQSRQPNAGNRRGQNPPNGDTRRGRPQAPERLCDDHPNPRPGQNCTENPDHFRPAQRPPD